jgi:hypothetical protein
MCPIIKQIDLEGVEGMFGPKGEELGMSGSLGWQ